MCLAPGCHKVGTVNSCTPYTNKKLWNCWRTLSFSIPKVNSKMGRGQSLKEYFHNTSDRTLYQSSLFSSCPQNSINKMNISHRTPINVPAAGPKKDRSVHYAFHRSCCSKGFKVSSQSGVHEQTIKARKKERKAGIHSVYMSVLPGSKYETDLKKQKLKSQLSHQKP